MALLKACPRCRALIPQGLRYCAACAPIAEAEIRAKRAHKEAYIQRKYNRQRDPKYLAFYRSNDWRITSRSKLASVSYKCEARQEHCTGLAVEVHHIKPIQTPDGWEARLAWDNLEAVCTACHNSRHGNRKKEKGLHVLDMREIMAEL